MNAELPNQLAELLRGTQEVLVESELVKKLARGKPLRSHRPPARVHSSVQDVASDFSRTGFAGVDPWRNQVQLVNCSHIALRRVSRTRLRRYR